MVQRMRATGTQGGVPSYELFIGIDYSGAQTPESRLKGLQIYESRNGRMPEPIGTPMDVDGFRNLRLVGD